MKQRLQSEFAMEAAALSQPALNPPIMNQLFEPHDPSHGIADSLTMFPINLAAGGRSSLIRRPSDRLLLAL